MMSANNTVHGNMRVVVGQLLMWISSKVLMELLIEPQLWGIDIQGYNKICVSRCTNNLSDCGIMPSFRTTQACEPMVRPYDSYAIC